ncbi:ribbon-helix-helix domain-containing protein [Spirillospora albida]|uniref:ribbon-helix-helix domain-containing protein n=1 Tax=Spirillospora albida TaxID=58123 RepID=UPI000ABB0781|nr:ribbon-helix-helix domain-containing protein [Spirillospora albida]
MARLNITLPDELAETLQELAQAKKIPSVSGFLADSARLKLAYLRDASAMDEMFGAPSPDEQALIGQMIDGGTLHGQDVA